MKKQITLFVLMLISFTASAQSYSTYGSDWFLGARIGIGASSMSGLERDVSINGSLPDLDKARVGNFSNGYKVAWDFGVTVQYESDKNYFLKFDLNIVKRITSISGIKYKGKDITSIWNVGSQGRAYIGKIYHTGPNSQILAGAGLYLNFYCGNWVYGGTRKDYYFDTEIWHNNGDYEIITDFYPSYKETPANILVPGAAAMIAYRVKQYQFGFEFDYDLIPAFRASNYKSKPHAITFSTTYFF